MNLHLRAVMDKIVVRLLEVKEKTTEGGIVLTGEAAQNQEPQSCGIVVSKGDAVPYELKPGDVILFHRRAGMDMYLDKTVFKTLKADEIYCVLEDNNDQSDQ